MALLTVKKVASFLSKGEPGKHLDSGSGADSVRGLHLVVVNKKNASWQLRYQINKRTRWMGLGSARDIPLAKARERARREREKLVDKIDPLAVRRAERAAQAAALKAITFAKAARAFIEQNESGWKNAKHRQQVLNTLREYAFPIIGNLPVTDIDTPAILKVLRQPVAAKNGFPAGPLWNVRSETASRTRGRIESVLGWATVSGYRSGVAQHFARVTDPTGDGGLHKPGFRVSETITRDRSIYDAYDAELASSYKNVGAVESAVRGQREGNTCTVKSDQGRDGSTDSKLNDAMRDEREAAHQEFQDQIQNAWKDGR
jgi:hypothetical protein